ncbi:hypothetical protein BC830DRAFT_889252 [Chytriomyces sp. MP71]|nr:hypothetical protein BC830DRAFT_889252 [Chytriomyces sp. MP71]
MRSPELIRLLLWQFILDQRHVQCARVLLISGSTNFYAGLPQCRCMVLPGVRRDHHWIHDWGHPLSCSCCLLRMLSVQEFVLLLLLCGGSRCNVRLKESRRHSFFSLISPKYAFFISENACGNSFRCTLHTKRARG